MSQQKIVANLWFDTEAEEAAEYYCSIFKDAKILGKLHYPGDGPGETGSVVTVDWELNGQKFTGINGGAQPFKFNEAISFLVTCADQDEIDYFWEKLGEGGEHGPCGWLKDRYGVSWQIVPDIIDELYTDPDRERTNRAFKAMMTMSKLDIAALKAAADGVPA